MKTNQFLLEKPALVGAKTLIFLGACLIAFSTYSFASTESATESITITDVKPTPLCVAISKGETDLVKKFVEYGADVNEKSNGMTPLMLAARYNHVEIIKYLLANGANAKTKDEKGFNALKHAELSKADDAAAYLRNL
ncbi:ankyrin repeat domain-containing protein [Flavobacterium caeni]|uniref:Ankyrin repeat-containing protein n=1 Tax=Flavobacterium caeni TaxID=490189 RepID=A0A1G5JVH7_9FLAO|nr:ankyrin repeat domain-containing protein [Flavobacterium caeni]SCY92452.1 Ankyrin repeat-containing protein [Flavobacterium caeni]